MLVRRTLVLGGSILLLGALTASSVIPVLAADCTLAAPDYVNVGTPVTIDGSGFPASTSVDIAIAIEGVASDAFSARSDTTGALHIALTPEDIDIGVTTVEATAGSACAAEVSYTVLAAGQTAPPAAPGVDSGTGAGPVPQTDIALATGSGGGPRRASWILALFLLGVGGAGLYLTRPTRRS